MTYLVSLIPLLVAVAFYAAFFKLAAFLSGRARLSWAHGLVFALLMVLILIAASVGSKLAGETVPTWIFSALAVAIGIALGGWFFSQRVTDSQGKAIGVRGALKLSAIAFTLLVGVGFLLIFIAMTMRGGLAS
jgi:phosphate/sulfate permease